MVGPSPTFAGSPGEDVEMFIRQCKLQWIGARLTDDEKNEAIATTIFMGCRDVAGRYVRGLSRNEKDDWLVLAEKLRTTHRQEIAIRAS